MEQMEVGNGEGARALEGEEENKQGREWALQQLQKWLLFSFFSLFFLLYGSP